MPIPSPESIQEVPDVVTMTKQELTEGIVDAMGKLAEAHEGEVELEFVIENKQPKSIAIKMVAEGSRLKIEIWHARALVGQGPSAMIETIEPDGSYPVKLGS